MDVPFDRMVRKINEDEQFRLFLEKEFPDEYAWYKRFSARNGPACFFARSALRRIFQLNPGQVLAMLGPETGHA